MAITKYGCRRSPVAWLWGVNNKKLRKAANDGQPDHHRGWGWMRSCERRGASSTSSAYREPAQSDVRPPCMLIEDVRTGPRASRATMAQTCALDRCAPNGMEAGRYAAPSRREKGSNLLQHGRRSPATIKRGTWRRWANSSSSDTMNRTADQRRMVQPNAILPDPRRPSRLKISKPPPGDRWVLFSLYLLVTGPEPIIRGGRGPTTWQDWTDGRALVHQPAQHLLSRGLLNCWMMLFFRGCGGAD